MSKLTAMQELKSYFEQQLSLQQTHGEIKQSTEDTLLDAIEVCKNIINTKEKQQIIEAHESGYN